MKIALQKIFEVGAQGISLTADGPIAHFAMMRELGANLDPQHLKTFFQHPSDSNQNVHVLLDLAHMLKLVRNSLASERVIISPSGEVKWEYIVKLHSLQESEGLRAGTKLTRKHIDWERCKMKVSLAAQTLSSSVADAVCATWWVLESFRGCRAEQCAGVLGVAETSAGHAVEWIDMF